jgi:hypothetical protein
MAVGAISRCLARYGEDTLITALQCVTHTRNNKPGALSAKIIKALCALLASDPTLRDSGQALFELFDQIDLLALVSETAADISSKRISHIQALIVRLRQEISKLSAS